MPKDANRRFRSSILKALASYSNAARGIEEGQALDKIAIEVVKCAVDRKDPEFMNAVNIIANRLDGKPTEHIEVDDSRESTQQAIGISQAFTLLGELARQSAPANREIDVSDRPVLLTQVRSEQEGRRETVGVRPNSGSSGESK